MVCVVDGWSGSIRYLCARSKFVAASLVMESLWNNLRFFVPERMGARDDKNESKSRLKVCSHSSTDGRCLFCQRIPEKGVFNHEAEGMVDGEVELLNTEGFAAGDANACGAEFLHFPAGFPG